MISPGLHSVLVAIPCGVTAAVLVYDLNRAIVPRIRGEEPWRRWRALSTVTAIAAVAFLQRGFGPLWVKRLAMGLFLVACAVVLRCSVPLKRLVERSLQRRRGG